MWLQTITLVIPKLARRGFPWSMLPVKGIPKKGPPQRNPAGKSVSPKTGSLRSTASKIPLHPMQDAVHIQTMDLSNPIKLSLSRRQNSWFNPTITGGIQLLSILLSISFPLVLDRWFEPELPPIRGNLVRFRSKTGILSNGPLPGSMWTGGYIGLGVSFLGYSQHRGVPCPGAAIVTYKYVQI